MDGTSFRGLDSHRGVSEDGDGLFGRASAEAEDLRLVIKSRGLYTLLDARDRHDETSTTKFVVSGDSGYFYLDDTFVA
jgi:hypothetical protein